MTACTFLSCSIAWCFVLYFWLWLLFVLLFAIFVLAFFSIGLCTSSPQPSSTCILKFFHTTLRECEWLAACVVMSLALSAKKRFLFALDVLHRFVIVFFFFFFFVLLLFPFWLVYWESCCWWYCLMIAVVCVLMLLFLLKSLSVLFRYTRAHARLKFSLSFFSSCLIWVFVCVWVCWMYCGREYTIKMKDFVEIRI